MVFDIILTYEKLNGNRFDVIMFRINFFIIHFHYTVYSIPPVNFTSLYSLLLGNQQCTHFGNMLRKFVFCSWFQRGFKKGWLLTLTNLDIMIETSLNNCLLSAAKTFLVGKPLKESPFGRTGLEAKRTNSQGPFALLAQISLFTEG